MPAPTGSPQALKLCSTCGSGQARERAVSCTKILNFRANNFRVWWLRNYPTRAAEVSLLSGKWLTDTVFGSLWRPGVRTRF
ncbi:hypothetical protein DBB42_26155 [Pseudomonas plecoglossicida]|uniref:Uncharacterized protein n=1 Tax=Pseudomonas plecoglossicida TaxID=70775 RepID=A0A2R7UAS0_PSEDL|nr:hypothetical protein DBB42_26155 [Pseudomonas plecoglossicida]